METAGKGLLVSAVVLAIVGLDALGLAKLGVDRVPGTLSWKSDNVTVFVPIGLMLLVFTSLTGRPLGRDRLSKRGVLRAATRAGLGHITGQTLRFGCSGNGAREGSGLVAAAMTGHSRAVYSDHYARPFRDAEARESAELPRFDRVRERTS